MEWIKRWVEGVWHDVSGQMIFILLVAVGFAVWAALQSYTAIEVALIFIGVLTAVAYVANSVRQGWPKGKRWKDDQALGDEINKWLRNRGLQLQDADVESGSVAISFALRATDPVGRNLIVVKAREESSVGVLSTVAPNPDHLSVIQAMSEPDKEEMYSELTVEIARMGVSLDAREFLTEGCRLQSVVGTGEEDFERAFFETFSLMIRATALAQIVISSHVRRAQVAAGKTPTDPPKPPTESALDKVEPPPPPTS